MEKSVEKKYTISIVAGNVHQEITDAMIHAAKKVFQDAQAAVGSVVIVPGSYEVPLAVQEMTADPAIDGIVVLGAIEKGETLDGEVMGHVVNAALMNLQLASRKPIGFGIIGPGATPKQMHERKVRKAQDAARAVLDVLARKGNERVDREP